MVPVGCPRLECFSIFRTDDLQRAQIRGLPGYPHLAIGEWIGEIDFVVRFHYLAS